MYGNKSDLEKRSLWLYQRTNMGFSLSSPLLCPRQKEKMIHHETSSVNMSLFLPHCEIPPNQLFTWRFFFLCQTLMSLGSCRKIQNVPGEILNHVIQVFRVGNAGQQCQLAELRIQHLYLCQRHPTNNTNWSSCQRTQENVHDMHREDMKKEW